MLMFPSDWIVPDWPAPANVRAVITARAGGVSSGPYATFNLGFSTGDDAAAVKENRERLRAMLPGDPKWLRQVHAARVVEAESAGDSPQADASTAQTAGTVCAIMIADCLPVLLTDAGGSVVAAAHAGWRGLAAGVIDNTVTAMAERGADTHALIAYIGPGIGREAFEVGDDVYLAFTANDPGAAAAFRAHAQGKWLADLPLLARRALERCGVRSIFGGE